MSEPLQPGTPAPDFTLRSDSGEEVTLSTLRGRTVVLAFYPMDWSPGCTNQMDAFTRSWERLEASGAAVYGISIDHVHSHRAWKEARGLKLPLLADFHPKGEVARRYGVFNDERGYARRTTFVIDPEGIIREVDTAPATDDTGAAHVCELVQRVR